MEPEMAGSSQENQTGRQLTRQDLGGSMFYLDGGRCWWDKKNSVRHPFLLHSFSVGENGHQISGQETDPSLCKDTLTSDSSKDRQEYVDI